MLTSNLHKIYNEVESLTYHAWIKTGWYRGTFHVYIRSLMALMSDLFSCNKQWFSNMLKRRVNKSTNERRIEKGRGGRKGDRRGEDEQHVVQFIISITARTFPWVYESAYMLVWVCVCVYACVRLYVGAITSITVGWHNSI